MVQVALGVESQEFLEVDSGETGWYPLSLKYQQTNPLECPVLSLLTPKCRTKALILVRTSLRSHRTFLTEKKLDYLSNILLVETLQATSLQWYRPKKKRQQTAKRLGFSLQIYD